MNKVIIWGSEGGIGNAILRKFNQEKWVTAAIARQISTASHLAEWQLEADFSNPDDVDRAAIALGENLQQADVLVFAAGDIHAEKVRDTSTQRWLEILNNNLTGAFLTIKSSLPLLKEDAHIFLLGAVSERLQLPGLSAYAAAKVGLEAFAVALAKEERSKNVSVVRPGAVATALWDKVPFKQPEKAYHPDQVAAKVWDAYQAGHSGKLDLA